MAFFEESDPRFYNTKAQELDDHLVQIDTLLSSEIEHAADPLKSHAGRLMSFSADSSRVMFGVISSCSPHLGSYRVALENGKELPCSMLKTGSTGSLGVQEHLTYTPGTRVLAHVPRHSLTGQIAGAIPDLVEDGAYSFADFIVQGSGVGLWRDRHHYEQILQTGDEGGFQDYSGGAPIDALSGDWTICTPLGGGLHLDPFLAYLRVDESCGLTLHYLDQHARLCGVQLDVHSGCHSESYRDDEGEAHYFRGESPYPHELLGAYEFGAAAHRTNSDLDVLFEKPEGKLEPVHADQQPFYRYQEYGGYLGQARIRQVCLPPREAGSQDLNRDSSEDILPGVFREQVSLDGAVLTQTAKEYTLAKSSILAIPRRKKPAEDFSEDADGARQENYKAAGLHGSAEAHAVGDISMPDDNEAEESHVRAVGVLDRLAYRRNWQGLHPFVYHTGDFLLPEESEVGAADGPPSFSQLGESQWLSPPETEELRVDHRYLEVLYHRVLSLFSLLEDGGVVLRGGGGEEIRFVSGSIQISCPGEIFIQPGRSLVAMAGHDISLRANKSADMSAGSGDLRLKGEVNVGVLAGNSGQGGILLESRATSDEQEYPSAGGEAIRSSGVVVLARNSSFSTMSAGVYMRTGSSKGQISPGPIVFDADKGRHDIRMTCRQIDRYVSLQIRDNFGPPTISAVNTFSAGGCQVSGVTQFNGSLQVKGSLSVRDNISIAQGHIASVSGGDVGRHRDAGQLQESFQELGQSFVDAAIDSSERFDEDVEQSLYQPEQIGSDEMQRKVMFGMRSEENYGTVSLQLPENHWQTLARSSGGASAWSEQPVAYQSTTTMPWPGKKAWQDQQSLVVLETADHTMYDVANGRAKDRDGLSASSPYKEPKHGKLTPKKLSEGYLIIDTY